MKKLIIALLCAVAALGATAQNANRSGFFIEAAIGGATGSTPRTSAYLDGNTLMAKFAGGTSFNIALGMRCKSGSHMAVDFRLEAQSPVSYVSSVPTGRFLIAPRYISSELFGNMSIYGTVGIGGAVSFSYPLYCTTLPAEGSCDYKMSHGEVSPGVAYMLGAGLNITTHFSVGFIWSSQFMFNQCRIHNNENLNWGMAGLQLGYRF